MEYNKSEALKSRMSVLTERDYSERIMCVYAVPQVCHGVKQGLIMNKAKLSSPHAHQPLPSLGSA